MFSKKGAAMCNCKKGTFLSQLYIYHYAKLAFRILLFLGAFVHYVICKVEGSSLPFGDPNEHQIFWAIVWIFFFTGMVLRLFPSKVETIGCQKQFKRNYVPTDDEKPSLTSWKSTLALTLAWFALNLTFGILYWTGVFDAGILVLITLAYGVCDIVCILFFCPLRDLFLKNKCCADCRIYNWDYAMMFTPFVFIPHVYTWTLLGMALVLLIIWEITYKLHPERFAKNTNASLACKNCKEKPCRHKKRIEKILQNSKEKLEKLSWWKHK